MKNKKLVLSALLSMLFLSMTACGGNNPTPVTPEDPVEEHFDEYVDALTDGCNGNILQAFNWTFNQIKENLPAIAEAGFTVVQTSPVQEAKGNGPSWWSYYQPISFTISEHSGFGNRAELEDLCNEAETYGIKIICDIVFNHLANISDEQLEDDGTPKVSPEVAAYEPYIYEHRNDTPSSSATFHHNPNALGSGSITQVYSYGKLPDLNTANPYVQQRALDLLKDCIDVGVDGFRFDAAKHIETPQDPQYASDFWPNTLGVAKEYYKQKTGEDLIAYGEILNDVDGGRDISYYTQYMKVTANYYVTGLTSATVQRKAIKAVEADFGKNTTADNLVLWAESHDTYTSEANHIGQKRLTKYWAVISSRKDAVGMFLARPNNTNSIGMVADHLFEDLDIGVINRFHNRFAHGYEEEQSAMDAVYINERYNDVSEGAVLVDFATTGKAEVTFNHLGTDVYVDQMTGNKVIVRNNKATVEFGSSGVIVLTHTNNMLRPKINISNYGTSFAGDLDLTISTTNATEASYSINGGVSNSFTGNETLHLAEHVDANGLVSIRITASNSQFSTSRTYSFKKVTLVDGYFNIVNLNPSYLSNFEIYLWCWKTGVGSAWIKDYVVQNDIILIDFSDKPYTHFLFATFEKGYVIPDSNLNAWDPNYIKQSPDILISDGFFDASTF